MTALFINVKPEECPGQGPVRRDRGLTGIPFRGTGNKEGVGSKLFDHVMRSCLLIAMSSMMRSWRMRTWRRTSQLLGGTVAWFGTTQACPNPRHATPSALSCTFTSPTSLQRKQSCAQACLLDLTAHRAA